MTRSLEIIFVAVAIIQFFVSTDIHSQATDSQKWCYWRKVTVTLLSIIRQSKTTKSKCLNGSVWSSLTVQNRPAVVAQLLAHTTGNLKVLDSAPPRDGNCIYANAFCGPPKWPTTV